jgi:hypothetical protein
MVLLANGHTVGPEDFAVVDGGLVTVDRVLLSPGDWVAQSYGRHRWPSRAGDISNIEVTPPYGSQKRLALPREMDDDLALLLGAYVAEGHTSVSNWTISITNSEPSVLARVMDLWTKCFGVRARTAAWAGKCPQVGVASKTVVQFLDALGCGRRASSKRIPAAILESPRRTVVAFLSGLALDAYTSVLGDGRWGICVDSPGLLDDVQICLRRLGVVSNRIQKWNPKYAKFYGEVLVHGAEAQRLIREVNFMEPYKQQRALAVLERSFSQSPWDVVPLMSGRDLYQSLPLGKSGRNGRGTGRARWGFLSDPRTSAVSRTTVERLAAHGMPLPAALRQVLDRGLHFSRVVATATVS